MRFARKQVTESCSLDPEHSRVCPALYEAAGFQLVQGDRVGNSVKIWSRKNWVLNLIEETVRALVAECASHELGLPVSVTVRYNQISSSGSNSVVSATSSKSRVRPRLPLTCAALALCGFAYNPPGFPRAR